MLKTNCTFQAVFGSRFHRNYNIVKKLSRSGNKRSVKQVKAYCKSLVANATLPLLKASAVLGIAIAMNVSASAQCDTFYNADAANPIHVKGLPKSREPYFVDIDGDGDLDCYVLDYYYSYKAPFLYKNIGTATFPVYKYEPAASGFAGDLSFANTNMAFVDIDGDGDYDCFLAEAYTGNGGVRIKYFENTGTAANPVFVENESKNPLSSQYGFYSINFTFADVDGDGDLDVYVYNDYSTKMLINEGTKTNANFVQVSYNRDANAGDRAYYDWNHDGLLDYFNMDYFYGFHYYKNIGPKSHPSYVIDDADGPAFLNGVPHQFTDINGDGAPEVLNRDGGFSTLAPVPVIDTSSVKRGGKTYEKLSVSPTNKAYTYQWYLNGARIGYATNAFIVALNSGFYSAAITDSCGTGVSLPVKVTYQPLAAETANEKTGLLTINAMPFITATAYPNPFTSQITVQLPLTKSAITSTVRVMDVSGKVMLTQTTSANTITIGSKLPAGAYILQVIQGTAVVYHTTIVKQ